MPRRDVPLIAGHYYHLYNRGHNRAPIFFDEENYAFFLRQLRKYVVPTHACVIAYVLMPNHYHLLLQAQTDSLSHAMQLFSISYTKAINKRIQRTGSVFEGVFQAKRVDRDEYLLHLSRYIHLNPYTSYIVKDIPSLTTYTFSSFLEFQNKAIKPICNKDIILTQFSKDTSYNKFVEEYAAYQRTLSQIKHLLLEK